MRHLYVYALVERSRRPIHVEGHRIEFVPVSGIHAAAERLARAPGLTESSLRDQHRIVVELARRSEAILPARFGAWVDLPELEKIVRLRKRSLQQAFDRVRGRQQMTVRIFGPPAIAEAPVRTHSSGAAYLEARRTASRPKLSRAAAAIQLAVKPFVEGERVEAGAGLLQTTMSHLVKKGRSREYKAVVNRIRTELGTDDAIIVSGPWPPFAFTPELWP
jgi:hypothetical protein